jgi:peptide/nickel transport system substrate-binding protein
MNLGIDRDALVSRIMAGSATAATGPFPSFFPFADPKPLPFDAAGARGVLDAAGWLVGSDGVRARGGQRLEIELTTYPQRPELGLLATAIQSMLREIGMATTLRQVEQITPIVNARDYEATMYALQTAPNADPGFVLNVVFSSWGDQNVQLGSYSPRIEAIAQQLNQEPDVSQRYALGWQAQDVLREEVPAIFLLSPSYHTVVTQRVRNYQPNPFDYYVVHPTLGLA